MQDITITALMMSYYDALDHFHDAAQRRNAPIVDAWNRDAAGVLAAQLQYIETFIRSQQPDNQEWAGIRKRLERYHDLFHQRSKE